MCHKRTYSKNTNLTNLLANLQIGNCNISVKTSFKKSNFLAWSRDCKLSIIWGKICHNFSSATVIIQHKTLVHSIMPESHITRLFHLQYSTTARTPTSITHFAYFFLCLSRFRKYVNITDTALQICMTCGTKNGLEVRTHRTTTTGTVHHHGCYTITYQIDEWILILVCHNFIWTIFTGYTS